MTRRTAVIGVAAVLASILLLSLAWGMQHAALSNPPVLGRPAPNLTIEAGAGHTISVEDLKGAPVVLNFWASWCQPCVEEADVLAAGAGTHQDVTFLGADNRDTAAGYQAFEEKHPHLYPAGPIVAGTYQSYGVSGLPMTFFIDSRGLVVASFAGPLSTNLLNHYLAVVGH